MRVLVGVDWASEFAVLVNLKEAGDYLGGVGCGVEDHLHEVVT